MASGLELLEETFVDGTLSRFARNEVPEVTDLALADTVDAAEALLELVGVPGQVVVDHQVSAALEVHPLSGSIVREKHTYAWIIVERRDDRSPLLTRHASMDDSHGVRVAKVGRDLVLEVVDGVAWFGEDQDLSLTPRVFVKDRWGVEDGGELCPLRVLAGAAERERHALETAQARDLVLELLDGRRGGRRRDRLALETLELFVGQLLELVRIGNVMLVRALSSLLTPPEHRLLVQPMLQPFATSRERAPDRPW